MSTTLHEAARRNDAAEVRRLLRLGANPVQADAKGRTPLQVAALVNATDAIHALCVGSPTSAAVRAMPPPADPSTGGGGGASPAPRLPPSAATSSSSIRRSASKSNRTHAVADQVEADQLEENKIESTEVVNPRVMRKIILMLLLPVGLLVFINGLWFGLRFLVGTFVFYFVCVGYFVSEITIRPPWYHHHPGAKTLTQKGCPAYWDGLTHNPKEDLGLDYEDVSIPSTNRHILSGWFVAAGTPQGSGASAARAGEVGLVLVHGGGRDRRAWLRHVPFLHKAGYHCLLFDFREHGLSTGNSNGFTYGMKERFDVLAAARYMKEVRHCRKVVVIGTSVGGSSVIMAGALAPDLIDGVVAENAITTCAVLQDGVIVNLFGGYLSRKWWAIQLFQVFRLTCSNWLNIRIGNKPSKHCQALHCVDRISPRPLLLLHGTNDDVVPCSHSEQLFESAKEPKELWLCDGAPHCGLYNKQPEEYRERMLRFLSTV